MILNKISKVKLLPIDSPAAMAEIDPALLFAKISILPYISVISVNQAKASVFGWMSKKVKILTHGNWKIRS